MKDFQNTAKELQLLGRCTRFQQLPSIAEKILGFFDALLYMIDIFENTLHSVLKFISVTKRITQS